MDFEVGDKVIFRISTMKARSDYIWLEGKAQPMLHWTFQNPRASWKYIILVKST